ncbi:UNVERIFIED_CONTAM: BURP domain-containing protein 16 [Sesamum radiatum]|uniref:BURP domain-containing protein 16 n=1 Tax=Sesamum radiatum TaxID=300843 RepID=A0AAW2U9E0_SESRA
MAHSITTFLLFCLSFMTYSALSIPPSFSIPHSSASTQIKLWSTNVLNEMPQAISTKLSPLTNQDSDHYAEKISGNDFSADTEFCSLAKLSCSTAADAYVTALVYNKLSTLKEGNVFHLSDLKVFLPHRAFLPSQIASKVPLTSKGIAKIFPQSSKEDIETTLYYCNAAAIKGELKVCPKSLEEMINFSKSALGKNKLLVLTSKSTRGSANELKIKRIKQYDVEKIVACHEMYLPFATYFCHSLPSSQIYAVDVVEPSTGAPVNTVVAVCHMDTSAWPEEHIAFKIVKLGPGQGEVCHWLSEIDVAWIAGGK